MKAGQRRFGKYPGNRLPGEGIPTAKASYEDGYQIGKNWTHSYYPGGPFIMTTYYGNSDADWKLFCEATEENYNEWHRGFKEGKAQKAYTPPEFDLDRIAILGSN